MNVPGGEAVVRLLLAFLFGALVGIERESHGRSAGLRTHALVCVAMCLLMVISLEIPWQYLTGGFAGILRIDPGRLAQGALAGMGFIGAGVVLKGRGSIRGVTTAASLWTVSAIGLATGMGNYLLATTTCGLSLVILLGLRARRLESVIPRDNYMRLQVSGPRLSAHLPEVEAVLAQYGADVLFVSLTHNLASGTMAYRFSLKFPARPDWKALCRDMAAVPGVERLIWLQGLVP
jgi:putative Mg2+ transporter-C (MgtC) family protein